MTARKLSPVLMGLALLLMPWDLPAKSDTARVTLSGGGLVSPIQITDAAVLALSRAWGSAFLDVSKPPLAKAPNGLNPYEVSIYSQIAENDIRKACVFFYAPGSGETPGVIYLPGEGTIWRLNTGTMIRDGRDGEWSYASPQWEAVVKPFLSRAESGLRPAAFHSQTVLDRWTKPLAGWLYVLDPRGDAADPAPRIWLVDPETSTVKGSIRTGYDPDFALSPDGSRLYIASGERETGELAVVDTATGSTRQIPFPDRILYQPWYHGLPPFSRMAMTADGRSLWISGQHVISPERVEARLSVFDTRTDAFLSSQVYPGPCEYGDFAASPSAGLLYLCGSAAHVNPVRLVWLDARNPLSSLDVELPLSRRCGVAEAFPLPGANRMAIVRTDGAVYEMDPSTRKVTPTSITGTCGESRVAQSEWPRSADGARLYLGYGGIAANGMSAASELRVFDSSTWTTSGRVQTSAPFWSAVASPDGKYVYAVAPEKHGIVVVDAGGLQEKRVIAVGNTPSLALVAPAPIQNQADSPRLH